MIKYVITLKSNSLSAMPSAKITCSGGLAKAGETVIPATRPEPERISFKVPLVPRRRRVLAANGDPLAQVERSRMTP
jgi:hypothetical protein